jgi:signal recognition particle subunit SEC65
MKEVFRMAKEVQRFTEDELKEIAKEFGIKFENKDERDKELSWSGE